jgi:hypothetical protein
MQDEKFYLKRAPKATRVVLYGIFSELILTGRGAVKIWFLLQIKARVKRHADEDWRIIKLTPD